MAKYTESTKRDVAAARFEASGDSPVPTWLLEHGGGPIVGLALHAGHAVRPELRPLLALSDSERLREEDPYTDILASVVPTRVIVGRSRFEVDLNRPRDQAIYRRPEDAWGLSVWKTEPSPETVISSLEIHDMFYAHMEFVLGQLVARHGQVVVFDLHSYNHRRSGPDGPPDSPIDNPEINLGTGTMNRVRWAWLLDEVLDSLSSYSYFGRRLDVRENIKFRGGGFAAWCHQTFPESVCVLSIEFKKFFMDEWTGEVDRQQLRQLRLFVESTMYKMTVLLGINRDRASA